MKGWTGSQEKRKYHSWNRIIENIENKERTVVVLTAKYLVVVGVFIWKSNNNILNIHWY